MMFSCYLFSGSNLTIEEEIPILSRVKETSILDLEQGFSWQYMTPHFCLEMNYTVVKVDYPDNE